MTWNAPGGFDREVLAVVVPTGTGRINPVAVDALEYLHAGEHGRRRHAVLVPAQLAVLPG
jgi:uncharacterized membrane protein